MRNLNFESLKCDKKYFLAFLITLICSIICGIVLYKPVTTNIYFRNLAFDYVFNVFNFKNTTLLIGHLLTDLIYLYIFLFICVFTKFKYVTLVFVFLRGLFFGVYTVILVSASAFGGIIVTLLVFLPASLVSIGLCFVLGECCKKINRKYIFILPVIISVIDLILYALLINVVFRVLISIV